MLSTSRIWKPAPPAPREPRETVWVSAKPGEREDAESRERWLAAAGELDGGGEEERARAVLAGETGMAEGGGGEEARKDLEGWLGAAMMFWVVGMAAGEGGVFWRGGPLLWAGAWLGGEAWAGGRGSRALLLRLAASGGGLAGSLSAMEVRAKESARSGGGSCLEEMRPSFFEDWPWPIVRVWGSAKNRQRNNDGQRLTD